MTKVLIFGVFDYFHYGHLKLFEQARKYGDYLIVAIQKDEYIKNRKPNYVLRYNYNQRVEIISQLRLVNEICPSSDVKDDISNIDFDILALGEDQNHDGFQYAIAWCEKHNKKVVRLKRTPGISSTILKEGG